MKNENNRLPDKNPGTTESGQKSGQFKDDEESLAYLRLRFHYPALLREPLQAAKTVDELMAAILVASGAIFLLRHKTTARPAEILNLSSTGRGFNGWLRRERP